MTTQISHQLKPQLGLGTILTTVAAVALIVALAFITLPRSGATHSVTASSATGADTPLVHFYGTGAPPSP